MTRSRHRREHEIQKAIADHLREHWPDMPFVGSVNGAFLGGGRLGAIRWNVLRSAGSSSGYPDVFVHWRGAFNEIGLAVEVKVPGARQPVKVPTGVAHTVGSGGCCVCRRAFT